MDFRDKKQQGMDHYDPFLAVFILPAAGGISGLFFVESGVAEVDVGGVHLLLAQADTFANTINMKWIAKEPPTLFFNGILTNSQLFCAFIKVPLQPYSLYWGYAAIFYGFTVRQAQFTNCHAKSGILSLLRGGERNKMIIELGEKLKALRTENHLRQDQVARLVNVEKSSISMYETGMRQPSYTTLVRLADVFNVTTDYLLGRKNSSPLDLSGLTAAEAEMINQLVASMTDKNRKLEELKR